MKQLFIFSVAACLLASCGTPGTAITDLKTATYYLSNDSTEQSMELTLMDSVHYQFILRVENKYQDTTDSYMGLAVSDGHKRFHHERKNCRIDFETGLNTETIQLLSCDCAELTVKAATGNMKTDPAKTKE